MKLIESCSPNFQSFFKWSQEYLKENGRTCKIHNTHYIKSEGAKCGGVCDGQHIKVAFKNPLFEETYVHEFSHLQQAVEYSPFWRAYDSGFWYDMENKTISFDSWDSVCSIIALEHDCESRVIEHSKKWNLFDNEEYARRSNVYLHYYQYLFLRGKWSNSTTIYRPQLVRMMPAKIQDVSEFTKIDINLMKAFEENLSNKYK